MLESILQISDGNLAMLHKAVADVPEEQMADQPAALPNHPAWVLGHLTFVRTRFGAEFKANTPLPENYPALFGRGSTPSSDRSLYPTKQALLELLTQTHAELCRAIRAADPATFSQPHSILPLQQRFPTRGHLIIGGLVMHEGLHIGQLTDWRRAHGLPRLIG